MEILEKEKMIGNQAISYIKLCRMQKVKIAEKIA